MTLQSVGIQVSQGKKTVVTQKKDDTAKTVDIQV
jgi:hypothetical protein